MNGPWFIETLARNGDVLHRHQANTLPIRLGRGYDNDFIVDDAYAAPRHAQVELGANGDLVLRDLGTRNGVVHKGKRRDSLVLDGDTVVRIGHTTLRVRAAGFPVEPELVDRTMHGWEGALPGLAGIALTGAVAAFVRWLLDTHSFELIRFLQALAIGIGAGLLWSGIWAFANRLFGRHARLGRHLFIFGCGVAAITAYELAAAMLGYAFSLEAFTRYGSHVAIALLAGMIYFHLATIKPQRTRRFASICVAVALLGSGLTLISNEQRNGRLGDELYMSVLMPPAMRVSADHSIDEFMGQVGAMKARLDVERARKEEAEG
jgi:pSer/pThr/pTyr-binding forkhead associated (FHA) protein